jgi:hypothetical protein
MGTKIIDLSAANIIKSDDYLPISQTDTTDTRNTYKVSTSEIKEYVNFDINNKISLLEGLVGETGQVDINFLNNFVKLSGDTMTGNLNMSGNEIRNFSANILEYTDSITLSSGHNGSIILLNRPVGVGEIDPKAIVTIDETPKLPNGFNVMLIQTGDSQVKISKNGNVILSQTDNALATRNKYSQINLCVLQQTPYTVWMSGDMV